MKQFELPYFGKIDVENITEEQGYLNINFQKIIQKKRIFGKTL